MMPGGIMGLSRRHVLGGYTAWMALLTAAYYALPGLRIET